MRINLITPDEHAKLKAIQAEFKNLTFQNVGYEGINRSTFTDIEKEKDAEVNAILKKSIVGFSRFQNFKSNNKDNALTLRFQYDWTAHDRSLGIPFTGVGYILLDELLNGFDK
jgi:hypothetical protein